MAYVQIKGNTTSSGHISVFGLGTSPGWKAAPRQRRGLQQRLPTSTGTRSQEAVEALKITDVSHGICLAAQLRQRWLLIRRAVSSEQEGVWFLNLLPSWQLKLLDNGRQKVKPPVTVPVTAFSGCLWQHHFLYHSCFVPAHTKNTFIYTLSRDMIASFSQCFQPAMERKDKGAQVGFSSLHDASWFGLWEMQPPSFTWGSTGMSWVTSSVQEDFAHVEKVHTTDWITAYGCFTAGTGGYGKVLQRSLWDLV